MNLKGERETFLYDEELISDEELKVIDSICTTWITD